MTAKTDSRDQQFNGAQSHDESSASDGEDKGTKQSTLKWSLLGRRNDSGGDSSSNARESGSGSDDSFLGMPKSSGEATLSQHLLAVMEQRRKRQEERQSSDGAHSGGGSNSSSEEETESFSQKRRFQQREKRQKFRMSPSVARKVGEDTGKLHQKKSSKKDARKKKHLFGRARKLPPLWEESPTGSGLAGKGTPLKKRKRGELSEGELEAVDYATFCLSPSVTSTEQALASQSSTPPPGGLPEVITIDAPLAHLPIVRKYTV